MSGSGVMRHTDGTYYLNASTDPPSEIVLLVNALARRFRVEAERYHTGQFQRSPNYEDIFYLASQVADSEEGELDNPALRALTQEIRADFASCSVDKRSVN